MCQLEQFHSDTLESSGSLTEPLSGSHFKAWELTFCNSVSVCQRLHIAALGRWQQDNPGELALQTGNNSQKKGKQKKGIHQKSIFTAPRCVHVAVKKVKTTAKSIYSIALDSHILLHTVADTLMFWLVRFLGKLTRDRIIQQIKYSMTAVGLETITGTSAPPQILDLLPPQMAIVLLAQRVCLVDKTRFILLKVLSIEFHALINLWLLYLSLVSWN